MTYSRPLKPGVSGQNAVLMYHSVGREYPDGRVFSTEDFRQHLQYLKENHRVTDLSKVMETDDKTGRKIALTFDGGYEDFYTEVVPLLHEYKVPSTVYLIPERIGLKNRQSKSWSSNLWMEWFNFMTENQVEELVNDELVTLGNKSLTHECMLTAFGDIEDVVNQVRGGKEAIENRFGVTPKSFCYPSGRFNKMSKEVVSEYHDMAVTTQQRLVNEETDPVLIPRFDADLIDAETLHLKLSNKYQYSRRLKSGFRRIIGLN